MREMIENNRYLFLDLLHFAIIITDSHSSILFANRYAEMLLGYERKEIEGQRLRIFFFEEDLVYLLPNIIYLTLYKNGFEGEILLKQKGGKKVFVNLFSSSFKEGGDTFLIFSFQEIQRLKRLEHERLGMSHWATIGVMVEEIAHQIRNPIASIGGYAKRLINRLPSSAKNRFYLDQIIHESNRLETMLRRIEEVILIPMPVIKKENVKEVIDEAVNMFSKKTQELDVSIHLETGSLKGDEYFFIDRTLIIKSIIYILENSLDAIIPIKGNEKRTIINLSVFQEDENIKLSISDRGEGISKKNMCKIFEPFFSTRPEKIGLGLTFTKKVIEEHKGTIKISSRLKRGTTVIISIPIDRRRAIRRKLIL